MKNVEMRDVCGGMMSQFMYISSPVPLEKASYGSRGDGVWIGSGYGYPDKVIHHLSNKYIYTLQMLVFSGDKKELNQLEDLKYDKEVLCEILDGHKVDADYFEFYSCWAYEEDEPKAKESSISLEELKNEDYLTLHDKQYIKVSLC